MTIIARIRVRLEGFRGGPGVATHYCLDPSTFLPDLNTFWNGMAARMPLPTVVTVEGSGDLVDDTTGDITGSWASGADTAHNATISGSYAGPTGIVVNWLTSTVIAGRRLRGRTFVVPLAAPNFDSDGSINLGDLTPFRTAAALLVSSGGGQLLVLHRPTLAGSPSGVTPGVSAAVVSSNVPDLAAVLRSRRD